MVHEYVLKHKINYIKYSPKMGHGSSQHRLNPTLPMSIKMMFSSYKVFYPFDLFKVLNDQ